MQSCFEEKKRRDAECDRLEGNIRKMTVRRTDLTLDGDDALISENIMEHRRRHTDLSNHAQIDRQITEMSHQLAAISQELQRRGIPLPNILIYPV